MNNDDKLKNFIQDNLEDFDTEMPSTNLWEKIKDEKVDKIIPLEQSEKPATKVIKLNPIWYKVAVAVLMVTNAYFIFLLNDENTATQIVEVKQPQGEIIQEKPVSPLYAEFAEVELVYMSKVNVKVQELKNFESEFPQENEEILQELEELSTDFNELKNEIDAEVMDEVILQAMVENYQIRLQILEDILAQINTYNEKNIPHEINI